jgi:TfoX/Sxy family transcriptional regulator of competence genes
VSTAIRRSEPAQVAKVLNPTAAVGHDGSMAYDNELADRVRAELEGRALFAEKAMFGGLAFLVNTHMACGVMGEDLMVRVGKEAHDEAIAKGAREMDKTGRPMRGLVVVPGPTLDADSLASWLEQAVRFAESEPRKPPKPPKR